MKTDLHTNGCDNLYSALTGLHVNSQLDFRKAKFKLLRRADNPMTKTEKKLESSKTLESIKAEALASAIRDGDKSAEAEMTVLYDADLRRILRTRTDRREDIDDLVNEVWIRAIPKLRVGALKDLSTLPSYLNSFARRVAANYLRTGHRKATKNNVVSPEDLGGNSSSAYSQIKWDQRCDIASRVLDELRMDRDREILLRFLVHEEDKSTLCKSMDLSTTAFNKVLYSARQRFKKLAGPLLDET